jgi:hypothetical protein
LNVKELNFVYNLRNYMTNIVVLYDRVVLHGAPQEREIRKLHRNVCRNFEISC